MSPEGELKRSFSLLESKMRQALKGDLDPAVYVMSADCGTGKTKTLQAVLRGWKSNGFPGDGAIVMVATLAEMDAIIAGSGLSHEDYAVFTSNEKYKAYGAGRSAANRVPVLFVTHTMARKMTLKAGSFAAVTEFHRDGKARALRVWDEKFDAAEGVAFDLADLYALPSEFKKLAKADLDLLWGLVRRCAEPVAGLKLDVPLSIVDVGDRVLKSGAKVGETPKRTLEALVKLAGSTAHLRGDEDAGWGFVGAGRSMPPDIVPLFVLDASARLTGSYRQLPAHGMKVVELEPALLTYEGVKVHWYNRGAGKSELRRPVERSVISKAIADLMNSKPMEQFLIVIAKEACGGGDAAATLPVELDGMVTDPDRVRVATWGRHIGTNEYRDIPNVIIVSSHNYQSQSYDALAFAANGKRLDLVNLDARREQEAEAFMHNVYQAVCRSSVRLRKGASSGDANVYLIMKDSDRRRGQVARAFPGCTIREWIPIPKNKETKHDLVLRILSSILNHKNSISLKDLGLACGGSGASYLTKVVNSDRFKEAISLKGIYRNVNRYYSKSILSIAA